MRRAAPAAAPREPRRPPLALHGNPAVSEREARLETRIAMAVVAITAATFLVLALGPHRIGDYFAETDFYGDYAKGARLIQHGRLIATRYGVIGPVYELTLALIGFVIRDLFTAAKLISVAGAAATLVLWFRLLAQRADTRVALAAVLFTATNGYFGRYAHSATTDTLANALQAAALCLLLATRAPRAALAAGAVAALAFLTRYNAVYLFPAGLVAILAGGTRYEARRAATSRFIAGFLAPVVPWVLYSLTHGAAFSFQLHHNIAYEVYAHARGITWDEYERTLQPQFHNLWQVIARDPGAVASRMAYNVFDHLRRDALQLIGAPVALLAALGLVLGALDGALRRLWPLWLAGVLLFLTLVPAFYSERYSLSLLPFDAALAALAVGSPLLALAAGPRRLWLKPALALLPLALATQQSVGGEVRFFDQLPTEVLPCADTLRAEKRPGDRVIARKPHLAAIAGVEPVSFPFTKTLPELADYARANRSRWLYVSWPEVESRPDYWYLLDTAAVVPGLTARAVTRPHPGVLYEIGPGFGTSPAWLANDTLHTYYVARAQLLVDGTNFGALFALAAVERSHGHLERARFLLERAASVKPDDLHTLLQLGDVVLSLNDAAAGVAIYDRAMAIDPGSLEARVGRGWASLVAGRDDEAGRFWRPVVDQAEDPATLEQMVKLYHALGDREAEAAASARLARLEAGH
jgi:tetratricopeptide (TPR) repeat protein